MSLDNTNAVGTLAEFVDGASNGLSYRNSSTPLTIDALAGPTLGVAFNPTGIASSAAMTGAAANPISGVTTAGGNIAITTSKAGDLTLAQNIDADGGSAALVSAGSASRPAASSPHRT